MSTYKELKRAVGKTIIKIEYPRVWDDSMKAYLHDPRIYLDDGSVLYFTTEEGEDGYGVSMGIYKPEKEENNG